MHAQFPHMHAGWSHGPQSEVAARSSRTAGAGAIRRTGAGAIRRTPESGF